MALNKEYLDIGHDIIGAAFDVNKYAGKGLREKYYQYALAYELREKGYDVKLEVEVPALYRGIRIENSYYADLVVDDRVIIEVKAVPIMTKAECSQLYSYLRLSDFRLGYLINFGAKDFSTGRTDEGMPLRHGIYRYVNNI